MATFIQILLRHRGVALAAILLSIVAAAYAARGIELRFQFRDFYDYPGNAQREQLKLDNDTFGDPAGYIVIMLEAKDVFRRDVLQYVRQLTAAVEPLRDFSRVRSLTNVNSIRGEGDEVITGALIRQLPKTDEESARLKSLALGNPLLVRRLVSTDATATAVLAFMRDQATATVAEQEHAVGAITKVLADNPPPPGISIRVTGAPLIEIETTRSLMSDQILLVPLVCTILGAMLYLIFRSMHGVLLCMASVSVATIWTAGLYTLLGRPVDLVGSVIPTTMLVYGVVDPVFVLARFVNKLDAGLSKHDAIVQTLSELGLPCFLTSLTTSIGFGAFVTCASPSVRFYGLTVGLGVLLAFVTTVTVLPLLLSVVPAPKTRVAHMGATRSLDGALVWVAAVLRPRPVVIVSLSVVILVLGGWFARAQHIDNAYVGSLPKGKTQQDVRALEKKLGGVDRMTVYLEGPADSMRQPEVLRAIETVDRQMEKSPEVTFSGSLADLVAVAHQAFQGGDPEQRIVPASRQLVAQYLTMVDPADRADFVTDDFSRSHIAVLLEDHGSESALAVSERLRGLVDDAQFERLGVKATVTGQADVVYRALDDVVLELLWGFVTAFLIVISFEIVAFRSLKVALLTVIPNLIPVVVCFLTTRLAHIPLRIDTVLVLCVSIGGLFNTTIHFVARVQQQVAAGANDPDAIIKEALRAIVPPSLFTALMLSAGFAAFMLSEFPGLQALGLLSMITLLSGFVSDLVFTPALIRLGYPWQRAFGKQKVALEVGGHSVAAE